MTASASAPSKHVRAYHTVRTAHLERSLELEPADLVYGQQRYDFDVAVAGAVASRARLEQAGDLRAAWLLARRGYAAVEINEPIALETVRRTALALFAIRLSDAVRHHRTVVVTYAIGNVPITQLPRPAGKARLGRWLDERLAPLVWRRCDRVAYGTGAEARLRGVLRSGRTPDTTTVPALPIACSCPAPPMESLQHLTQRALPRRSFREEGFRPCRECLGHGEGGFGHCTVRHRRPRGAGSIRPGRSPHRTTGCRSSRTHPVTSCTRSSDSRPSSFCLRSRPGVGVNRWAAARRGPGPRVHHSDNGRNGHRWLAVCPWTPNDASFRGRNAATSHAHRNIESPAGPCGSTRFPAGARWSTRGGRLALARLALIPSKVHDCYQDASPAQGPSPAARRRALVT